VERDDASPDTQATFRAAVERAKRVASGEGGGLVPFGQAAPEQVRTSYGAHLADLTRAQQDLRHAAEQREAELKEQLDRQLAELRATMAPLEAQMKKMQEAIWTVNLYLGRDEQIELVADGEPAPVDTPITLRQMVLAMDEECLVAAEDGGIDIHGVNDFTAWLAADPAHLDRVLPDPKGVVVLVPTRKERDYGNMFTNAAMTQANKTSFWLIRNGGRLLLMTTDLEVGERLLPTRSEFVDYFTTDGRWGPKEPLEPGSDAWVRAEQSADARRRHYMRIMLVLQGLADRTTVFYPLPGKVNFLSLEAQDAGTVRIINEIDNVLTTGRLPFRQWQRQHLKRLRPGMRIIGAFQTRRFGYDINSEWAQKRGEHSRVSPGRASLPHDDTIYTIEERRSDGGLVFRYARTDANIWDDELMDYRAPKTRASCTVYPDDDFVLPFDGVSIEELRVYLEARTERHAYIEMVPVLKSAIRAKEDEAAQEAPFRTLLAGKIAERWDLDVATAEEGLGALVDWWKLGNRWHRPLVGDPAAEAKAIGAILTEWSARRQAAQQADKTWHLEAGHIEAIRRNHPEVICVARRRDGKYSAFEPAEPGQKTWLTEHSYAGRANGSLSEPKTSSWKLLAHRTLHTLTVLWSTPAWTHWNHDVSAGDHLTGPELQDLTAKMVAAVESHNGDPIAVTYAEPAGWDGRGARTFFAYGWQRDADRTSATRDPAEVMVVICGKWKRGPGGAALEEWYPLHGQAWNHYRGEGFEAGRPWQGGKDAREILAWSDEQQLGEVRALQHAIAERNRRDHVTAERGQQIFQGLAQRWEVAEWERQHQRFLQDYAGAEDLWEGHKKTLRVAFIDRHGRLRDAIREAVNAGVDLNELTVAQVVAQSVNAKYVVLPEGAADMPLVIKPEGSPT
jgi:hypothetical protein